MLKPKVADGELKINIPLLGCFICVHTEKIYLKKE